MYGKSHNLSVKECEVIENGFDYSSATSCWFGYILHCQLVLTQQGFHIAYFLAQKYPLA